MLLTVLAFGVACAPRDTRIAHPETRRQTRLHAALITTHLSPSGSGRPLVIYATGDRGWGGRDVEVFRRIADWGYPVLGISSPDYLRGFNTGEGQASVDDVARDFGALITDARQWLGGETSTEVVMVGVSRGADLAVAASGSPGVQAQLAGVVAIGLTREEEYVRGVAGVGRADMLSVYDYLPQLGTLPLTVIQSTHDEYLPAAAARGLFGDDTPTRRLMPIEAVDHSFSDAREQMYSALNAALLWTAERTGH